MTQLRIAAGALNQTPLDWNGNSARIRKALAAAKQAEAAVLCLPELCISGYGCEDMFLSEHICEMALRELLSLVPETHGLIAAVGLPLRVKNEIYNVACLMVDGKIAGFVAKQFLCNDGIHYEDRWFQPWPRGRVDSISIGKDSYPVGDLVFDVSGLKIGFEICEDAWVKDRPAPDLTKRGVQLILNPSASHFSFRKFKDVRQGLVRAGISNSEQVYVYANLMGNEAGRAIYDGGALIAAASGNLAVGERFSFADVGLTCADVDFKLAAAGKDAVAAKFDFKSPKNKLPPASLPEWESSTDLVFEEFSRAVSLGLFDYLRKSRSNGFVVSVSGGADSSAVVCLIGLMAHFALRELGFEKFKEKLAYIPTLSKAANIEQVLSELLVGVYQRTAFSSKHTFDAAQVAVEAIGGKFVEFDVENLVQQYHGLVSKALNIKLNWQEHDVALQNIQARVRSPGAWMIANLRNALLLATSNRSEAAVGYATMDGDTSGSISPLAGIDKAFLLNWLKWLESKGPEGLFAVPELAVVTSQAPTAELRPQSASQTDEADLMPYVVLDFIERLAIDDKLSPQAIVEKLVTEFTKHSRSDLLDWTKKFFRLWSRNQWKRERYAPAFHLDDHSLDPKTWCRFPILSGGYEKELSELK